LPSPRIGAAEVEEQSSTAAWFGEERMATTREDGWRRFVRESTNQSGSRPLRGQRMLGQERAGGGV
jgi:hypothetical protein